MKKCLFLLLPFAAMAQNINQPHDTAPLQAKASTHSKVVVREIS